MTASAQAKKVEDAKTDGAGHSLGPRDQSGPSSPSEGYRRLSVEDGWSYLEMVKIEFQERPDVYYQFLDVMKDFKSQTIGTLGVMERVSTLFNGHPALLQGFNTFLPPDHRIECSSDGKGIKLGTPSDTRIRSTQSAELKRVGNNGTAVL